MQEVGVARSRKWGQTYSSNKYDSTSSEVLAHDRELNLLQLPKECEVSEDLGHNSTSSELLDHVRAIVYQL